MSQAKALQQHKCWSQMSQGGLWGHRSLCYQGCTCREAHAPTTAEDRTESGKRAPDQRRQRDNIVQKARAQRPRKQTSEPRGRAKAKGQTQEARSKRPLVTKKWAKVRKGASKSRGSRGTSQVKSERPQGKMGQNLQFR